MDLFGALILCAVAGAQIALTRWYLPKSIRSGKSYADKTRLGKIPFSASLRGLVCPRWRGQVDGVFHHEIVAYVGAGGLIMALLSRDAVLWGVCFALLLLSRGGRLFRALSPIMMRIPARWLYFVAVTLTFMAVVTLTTLPLPWIKVLVLLQCWDLIMNTSQFMTIEPFSQRWERPSEVFNSPLVDFLKENLGQHRISGLPYPLRTGQLHGFKTLGYNGGAQLKAMAAFRYDSNPDGSGAHSWFDLYYQEADTRLDWYGVKYLFTYRRLNPQWWRETPIPHLYENPRIVQHVPDWEALEAKWTLAK